MIYLAIIFTLGLLFVLEICKAADEQTRKIYKAEMRKRNKKTLLP